MVEARRLSLDDMDEVAVIHRIATDMKQLGGGIAGFASSVAFVFIFSLIARSERYARRDVERLNQQVAELATIR